MCTACLTKTLPTDDFAEHLVGMLDGAAVIQMLSIGHRTGLLDAMAELPPGTSSAIAHAAGLNERYVREWLGAMVTGGVVAYDPATREYHLPPSHAALLTRASVSNIAATAQFLPVLAGVEDDIVECFRAGGGVPYSAYPRFHQVMAEESDMTVVAGLEEHILPLVPGLTDQLAAGIDVLDVGCGRGHGIIALAEAYPNSRFVGLDLSKDAIAYARDLVVQKGLTNARFEQRDLSGFDPDERFDLVTAFDAVHDQADPAGMLAGVAKALKPSGTFLMQDIAGSSDVGNNVGRPLAPFTYTISCLHCMTVSLAQGGAGLGAAWGEELAQKMLADAGFSKVMLHRLDHDILNAFYVAQR